jgi:hypothetical protein
LLRDSGPGGLDRDHREEEVTIYNFWNISSDRGIYLGYLRQIQNRKVLFLEAIKTIDSAVIH